MTDVRPSPPTASRGADPAPAADGERPRVTAHAVFAGTARPARRSWRHANLPAAMLVGTLCLTVIAAYLAHRATRASRTAQFESAVQASRDQIRLHLDRYLALLEGARGLFAASHDVTRDEFRRYVERLQLGRNAPGIRGIGYSRWLNPPGAPSDSASLARAMRGGGAEVGRLDPATPRAEYHAIVYLEPLDERNRHALGFDMFTDSTRHAAMTAARDSGDAEASGLVTLRQEIDGQPQPGFLVYLPVYAGGATPPTIAARRAALVGFVYAPFRVGDLFTGVFAIAPVPDIEFRVFDGADTTAARAFYATSGAPRPHASAGSLVRVERIPVAGRQWTIVYTPHVSADGPRAELLAIGVALFGTMLGVLLARVTRAEIRAREDAERSEAVRGRFFAAMSHELRTPVNAVLGYNDLLLAGVYGPLADAQERGVQRSQRAARHLLELINDVLDLSKLEAGKMDIAVQPVRLEELLDDLLVTIRPMAEERACPLRFERDTCGCTVDTDPRRLRQILLNLLSNATKFGAGQPVSVHCARLPHGAPLPGVAGARGERRRTAGDAVVITVTDGGPGIARADQERIFEEFVQLPGTTPGGTGLGLPISRRLAELLGGHLTLESAPGRGSAFSLTIPLRRAR